MTSETMMQAANILLVLTVMIIAGFKRFYFPEYLKEKGKNLATKEDVEVITKKIESVKGAIGSQLYIHQMRYQNEFNILKDLAEKLVELRDSALSLRPVVSSAEANTEEGKKKFINHYYEAMKNLYKFCEIRKPFYPDEIYNGTKKLDQIAWKEYSQYLLGPDPKEGNVKYWKTAADNAQKISELADEMMELIRDRVKYWEKFEV